MRFKSDLATSVLGQQGQKFQMPLLVAEAEGKGTSYDVRADSSLCTVADR